MPVKLNTVSKMLTVFINLILSQTEIQLFVGLLNKIAFYSPEVFQAVNIFPSIGLLQVSHLITSSNCFSIFSSDSKRSLLKVPELFSFSCVAYQINTIEI